MARPSLAVAARGIAFEDFVTVLVFGFRPPGTWFDVRGFEMQEFSSLFEGVEDPRCGNATRHSPHEILLSVLCGGEGCADMERFGRAKETFLRRFMTLAHGIPGHDAFSDLFNALDPDGLRKVLLRLLEDWSALLEADVIAIDGKSLRRSFADAAARSTRRISNGGAVVGDELAHDEAFDAGRARPRASAAPRPATPHKAAPPSATPPPCRRLHIP